jgi:hypothetical protein
LLTRGRVAECDQGDLLERRYLVCGRLDLGDCGVHLLRHGARRLLRSPDIAPARRTRDESRQRVERAKEFVELVVELIDRRRIRLAVCDQRLRGLLREPEMRAADLEPSILEEAGVLLADLGELVLQLGRRLLEVGIGLAVAAACDWGVKRGGGSCARVGDAREPQRGDREQRDAWPRRGRCSERARRRGVLESIRKEERG